MKKSVFILLLLFAIAGRTFSQCIVDTSILAVGFYPPDTLLPCAEDSIFYDEVLQFKNFSQVSGSVIGQPGLIITIISVQIDSVKNLPPGISYTCNTPNCFYTTGEKGCVRLSGTTTAPAGIYNLGFYATLMVDFGIGPIQYAADSQFLASNGLGYSLTVLNPGGICPNKHSGQLYFNASVSTPSICEGDTVQLHTLTSGGIAPYTYLWSPGVNLSDSTIADPLLYPNNLGTYTVTVTDDIGLSATDSVIISYAQEPSIALSNDTTTCPGDSVQLVASGGTTYNWSPATGLSATDISNPVASPPQTTTYTVTVSNGSCSSASDSVMVTVDTVPSIALSNDTTTCPGDSVQLVASGGTTYNWSPATGLSATDISNPVASPPQTTTYTVTVSNGSCSASDSVMVTVDTVHPIAAFDSIINNFTVLFINNSSGASSYYWDFGDGSTSTAKNPQHQYAQHASYQVTLVASNCGFSDTVTNVINLTVGISDLSDQNLITVYPNPSTGVFELQGEEFAGDILSYEVMSACGGKVKTESFKLQNSAVIHLDLSDQSKGIYFLKVLFDSGLLFRKIVIQ